MRWLTGGSCTILACAVLTGCAGVPGTPTSQEGEANRPAESATPTHPTHGTAHEPGTQPVPPQPQIPSPRVPPRTTDDPPGAPGSPVTYDVTNLQGLHPARVRRVLEERLAAKLPAHCRANLCGITFVVSTQDEGKCFRSASPQTVYPGGVITMVVGRECDQPERDEPPTEQPSSGQPGESVPEQPAPGTPSGPTTTTTTTTAGDGG